MVRMGSGCAAEAAVASCGNIKCGSGMEWSEDVLQDESKKGMCEPLLLSAAHAMKTFGRSPDLEFFSCFQSPSS